MAGRGKPQARASSRSAARLATVQALYQMDMTGIDLNEVIAEFEAYRLGKEIEDRQYCDAEAGLLPRSRRGRGARTAQDRSADR
jgi:N utilization substance protein B